MRRNLALAFLLCFCLCSAATSGFAQSRLTGKWATDRPADPLTRTNTERRQNAQLEVTVEGAKSSGSLSLGGLGGAFYTFRDGKVTGSKIQFRTDPSPELPTWTIELVDDNTVMLYRGPIPVVGSNVPDRHAALGGTGPGTTSVQGGSNATISGAIQDVSKAFVPGAMVTATNVDTGTQVTAVSNDSGLYSFSGVTPGTYTITTSLPGFKSKTVSNLRIGDTPLRQDLTLELSGAGGEASLSPSTCSANGVLWCVLLHRAN